MTNLYIANAYGSVTTYPMLVSNPSAPGNDARFIPDNGVPCSGCQDNLSRDEGLLVFPTIEAAERFGRVRADEHADTPDAFEASIGFVSFGGDDIRIWSRHVGTWNQTDADAQQQTNADAQQQPISRFLPRNAADAIALAGKLQDFARWLPGGELEATGHEHARNADLCGQYEAIVCPTFGWTPRNGQQSSMYARTGVFFGDMDQFERDHAHLSPLERLTRWMERYEAGGFANRAITEHAAAYLEDYKVDGMNQLLTEVLGWEPLDNGPSEYEVLVRVERTRTVTEEGYVRITVSAQDEDDAMNQVTSYEVRQELDYANFEVLTDDIDEDLSDWDAERAELR